MNKLLKWAPLLLITFLVAACEGTIESGAGTDDGGGSGDGGSVGATNTRISGTVTLSSSVVGSNKPGDVLLKDLARSPLMKANADGSFKVANKPIINQQTTAGALMAPASTLSNAFVYVYDASHPEWLAPVAQDKTNAEGAYAIEAYGCTNLVESADCVASAAANGNLYTDGDPLPVGRYTMLVFKPSSFDPITGVTRDSIVAVMPAFKAEGASVEVETVEAEVSDVTPRVLKMFGADKNTDGTNTWGSENLELAPNASIQVTFDMAMSRGSVQNIDVTSNGTDVGGAWKLSADWLTATFKPDAALTPGVYQVEVPGSTTNVYGNDMGDAAVGTFTALAATDGTGPSVSQTSPSATTGVKTSTPIRIKSNEALDVNTLSLDAEPDVGIPGVLFVGENGGEFIYEFILRNPLQLDTSYSYTIGGIADMSGNTAGDLIGGFSTESSGTAAGVDASASSETQTAQSAIAEIFAKWVRAMNDRNLSQLQSLMTGGFVFEYSVLQNGFMDEDVNRNGRLSLNEFIGMMEKGLTHWEYCELTITGDVAGAVNLSDASNGDFEFELNFDSAKQSQDCLESGPQQSMFASVKNTNGAWKLARMSEGFDHRGTALTSISLLEAILSDSNEVDVRSGDTLAAVPSMSDPLTFRFDTSVQGVNNYILLVANARHPAELGIAIAISEANLDDGEGDVKSVTVPDAAGNEGLPSGAVDVSELFGFDPERDWGIDRSGETFLWEIIGLGSLTPGDFSDPQNLPSVSDLVRDFKAVSVVKKFKNPGERQELTVNVATNGSNLVFDEFIWGYDAGSDGNVDITVTTPNLKQAGNGGMISVSSNSGWDEHPLNFDSTGTAEVTVPLFRGSNWVTVTDGGKLYRDFQVTTIGGPPPAIEVGTITAYDSMMGTLGTVVINEWNFGDAPTGTVSLDATWNLDTNNTDVSALLGQLCSNTGGWAELSVWVHSNSGAYGQYNYCQDSTPFTLGGGSLTVNDMAIFQGENWINVELRGDPNGDGSHINVSSHFGAYTDTGTVFVAPIALDPAPYTAEGNLSENGNWGQGSDWNATAVTTATNEVTITGTFANPGLEPFYHAGSDGAAPQDGLLTSSGAFEFKVTLYTGWNWIGIDDGNGQFYNLNIYTDNGANPPRPEIVDVNGLTPTDDFGQWQVTIDSCTATLNGTAPGNTDRLSLDWNGSTDTNWYGEHQDILLAGDGTADGPAQNWAATFQVISGTNAQNFVNLYDDTNGTYAGIEIRTSAASCEYSEPVLELTQVVDGNDTVLVDLDGFGTYGVDNGMGYIDGTTATTVSISGTSSIPNRNIKLTSGSCGSTTQMTVQSDSEPNLSGLYEWTATMKLYDPNSDQGVGEAQWFDINDGRNWKNLSVLSDNGETPPLPTVTVTPPADVTVDTEDCNYRRWSVADAGGNIVTRTLSGSTSGKTQDGHGQYWNGNSYGTFEIVGGSFNFNVDLYDGDNWIHISDADWNNYNVDIQVTNGMPRPQFVYITDPVHGSTNISGDPVTVSGGFGNSGFVPDSMNGFVEYYDTTTASYVTYYFDSTLVTPNEFGDLPMTYDPNLPGNGFSLNVTIPEGTGDVWIEVDGCGTEGCHGHSIALNSQYQQDDNYYKADAGGPSAAEQARQRRFDAARR